jgi:dinuclear metal center YbgI/SA1388 family protein
MQRAELESYLDQYLEVGRYRDYCPNGLQVEGRAQIRSIVSGVSASLALLNAARAHGADAIFVHHGYFWRGEDARVTGTRRARLALLLAQDINLFAYHLPLDAHPEVGNNVQLARVLGLPAGGRFCEQDVGMHGAFETALSVPALAQRVHERLGRAPQVIGRAERMVRRVAWCTGAAQGYLEDAVRLGVDAFITGEISEQTVHLAREADVAFIAAGHHATERYGICALGDHLAVRFGLTHRFIDLENPV